MILQSLYSLYDRLSCDPSYCIAPQGYSLQKVVFKVVLKPDGTLFSIEDARIKDKKGNLVPRQILVPGQSKKSGSGLNPGFLWDTSAYMLGFKPKDENPERTVRTFESFRKLHLELKREINSGPFMAVCKFLEMWKPEMAMNWPVLNEVGNGYGVFQIIGESQFVHQEKEIRDYWLSKTIGGDQVRGQCLITGNYGNIARLHYKIKRVGQGESQLVSFNDEAYQSYGKVQSYNAPVSDEAAFKYATALNALTDGPKREKHSFRLGDAIIVFWTDKPTNTEDIFAIFAQGTFETKESDQVQDEEIRNKIELFLNALRKGRQAYGDLDREVDHTSFYILCLSAQTRGRIGVRFFFHDRLSALLDNLRRHYEDMSVVRMFTDGTRNHDPEFPTLWQILGETCPKRSGKPDRDKVPPILEGPLIKAVITGSDYPAALFTSVVRRIHADHDINYIRACVIAGYLRRNMKREVSMSLDKDKRDPAYRLGRLFAVLEKTQFDALGKTNTTIRERFYSSASSTPSSVLPRLLRMYQHHLAKLEGGLKISREKLVQEIMGPLEEIPAYLGLADQGMFALGYYHQMKDLWTSTKEKELEKGE